MKRDLPQFITFMIWNIILPIGIPILAVILFFAAFNRQLNLYGIFNKPDFLLISAMLCGESFAELKSFEKPEKGVSLFTWFVCHIGFQLILFISAILYGILYFCLESHHPLNLSWVILGFLLTSAVLAILSWLSFNHQRNNYKKLIVD